MMQYILLTYLSLPRIRFHQIVKVKANLTFVSAPQIVKSTFKQHLAATGHIHSTIFCSITAIVAGIGTAFCGNDICSCCIAKLIGFMCSHIGHGRNSCTGKRNDCNDLCQSQFTDLSIMRKGGTGYSNIAAC